MFSTLSNRWIIKLLLKLPFSTRLISFFLSLKRRQKHCLVYIDRVGKKNTKCYLQRASQREARELISFDITNVYASNLRSKMIFCSGIIYGQVKPLFFFYKHTFDIIWQCEKKISHKWNIDYLKYSVWFQQIELSTQKDTATMQAKPRTRGFDVVVAVAMRRCSGILMPTISRFLMH